MPTSDQHRQLRGELTEFLLDAFTSQELGRLLQRLTVCESLRNGLPPVDTTSPEDFTQRVVDALFRRALHTHRAIYDALIAERPSRGDEILRLAESFGVPDLHPGPLPLPPPLHPSHPPIRVTPTATPPPPPQRAASTPPHIELSLRAWTGRHPFALLCVLLVPLAATALVGLGMHPDPTRAVPHAQAALFAGQAVLAGLVTMCLAYWSEPSATSSLGPAINATIEPATSNLAVDAVRKLRRTWIALWICWGSLYGFLFLLALVPPFALRTRVEGLTIAFFNNGATAATIAGFWILSFHRVELPSRRTPQPDLGNAGVFGATVLALYLIAQCAAVVDAPASSDALGADGLFRVLSGLISAVAMMMYVGRLDSVFLGVAIHVLVPLYIYAAIQPGWPVLHGLITAAKGPVDHAASALESVESVLFAYAWFAKLLLFIVSAWLYDTGRLEYYFLRVREHRDHVHTDWQKIRSSQTRD